MSSVLDPANNSCAICEYMNANLKVRSLNLSCRRKFNAQKNTISSQNEEKIGCATCHFHFFDGCAF